MPAQDDSLARTPVSILCYHRVVPDGEENCLWTLGVRDFERQMRRLASGGYQTISLADFCEWQTQSASLPAKPVILTFDDGQEGFSDRVAPILAKHGFRATLFLIVGMLGKEVHLTGGPPFRVMSQQEAVELSQAGFDMQSHGLNHGNWTQMGQEELRQEIAESARILEESTGRAVQFVAYPYGAWNRRVRDLVESLEFTGACTSDPGNNGFHQDRFLLLRRTILCRKFRWFVPWALYRSREARRRFRQKTP